MSGIIGVLVIALILGFVLGIFIKGTTYCARTYATILGLSVVVDVFLGHYPFYEMPGDLPISGVFFASVLGIMIGRFVGGR